MANSVQMTNGDLTTNVVLSK
ncbi:hypothetical protein CCACVL1_01138, partial [Corchorus capsularis]